MAILGAGERRRRTVGTTGVAMRVEEPGRDRGVRERSTREPAPAGSDHAPAAFSPRHLHALQRSVGNRAVTAMLAGQQDRQDSQDHRPQPVQRAAEANAARVMAAPVPETDPEAHDHEHEHDHANAQGHRHGDGGRHSPSAEVAVQRAVGFEFEAQWNVRRMEENSEEVRDQRAHDRERLIDAKILEIFLRPSSPYHSRLTADERRQVAEDGGAALRAEWFGGDGLLREQGVARLAALDVTDDTRQGLITSLMARDEVTEAPLPGENLGKGRVDGLVVKGTDFDLTADASPSGGSNLEWITDPLTSVAQVGTVMDQVTAMAGYLDGRKDDTFIPSEDIRAGGGTPEPRLRIYPDGNPLSFAPQATFGAKLERLPTLIDYLGDRAPMSRLERVPVLGAGRVEGRRQAAKDLSGKGLGDLPAALAGARGAVAALLPRLGFEAQGGEANALTGLVTHLAAYLMQGQAVQAGGNAKTIAGALMSRTDFARGFGLLSQRLKDRFQENPDQFTGLVLSAAHLEGTGEQPVFGAQVERGLANDRTRTTVTLTRAQWLSGLVSGHDLLKNWQHLGETERSMVDQDSAEAVHKSLGALGDQQNLVGPQGDQEAIVTELRRMQDNVRTDQLRPLAVAVFKLVERLNADRTLKYGKRR
ncbi:hypothetical protein [Streptomyces sp. NPDC047981]|uniref:hypothetical protein n=1 Tax=Streptomyces sp. NPDC047981 TaxID=3154610 RepID=UPI00343A3FE5